MQEYLTAVRVLKAVIEGGQSMRGCFTEQDSPLGKQLCYGVTRRFYSLSKMMSFFIRQPLATKHFDIELLILAGMYSIDHLNRPAHASVNRAVETTLKLKKSWAKGLVNGVLRNYMRQAKTLRLIDDEAITDHPAWLVRRLQAAFPEHWQGIVAANNQQAPMTLRVNLNRTNITHYQAQLADAGLAAYPGRLSPGALYLEKAVNVTRLPGFTDGLVSVQDEASQLAAGLLDLAPGVRVLDACAAPGGKTCHMLEMQPDIRLTSIDIDTSRLDSVRENLLRLGLTARLLRADLATFAPGHRFERILLDLPCSATGIIRRHPDIKLLRRDADIAMLAITQGRLLARAWALLAEGGILVYSTCSLLPEENEQCLAEFMTQESSAMLLEIDATWGLKTPHGRQLLPDRSGTDGFFYARLQKIGQKNHNP